MPQWWVFIQDTNGSRRFVGAPYCFASREAADARIEAIKSAHNKPHKVDYWAVEGNSESSVKERYGVEG